MGFEKCYSPLNRVLNPSSIKLLPVDQKNFNKWSLIKNKLWSKIEFLEEGGKAQTLIQ
jgi:hypothetical protein